MSDCEWIMACNANDNFVSTLLDGNENVIRTFRCPPGKSFLKSADFFNNSNAWLVYRRLKQCWHKACHKAFVKSNGPSTSDLRSRGFLM